MESYHELKIWQVAIDLGAFIFKMGDSFPAGTHRELTSELAKSAIFISSTIARGWEFTDAGQKIIELQKAAAETFRLESLIFLAARLNLIEEKMLSDMFRVVIEERKMINDLIDEIARSN